MRVIVVAKRHSVSTHRVCVATRVQWTLCLFVLSLACFAGCSNNNNDNNSHGRRRLAFYMICVCVSLFWMKNGRRIEVWIKWKFELDKLEGIEEFVWKVNAFKVI